MLVCVHPVVLLFRTWAYHCFRLHPNTAMSCSQAMPPTLWRSARLIMITRHCSTIEKQKAATKTATINRRWKEVNNNQPIALQQTSGSFCFFSLLPGLGDIVAGVDCFSPFRATLRTPLSHVYFSCGAMMRRSSTHANAARCHHCNSQAVPHKLFFVWANAKIQINK